MMDEVGTASAISQPRMEFGTAGVHASELVAIWSVAFVLRNSHVFAYDDIFSFYLADGTGFRYLCFFFILQRCVLDSHRQPHN
jgi:hypothetical protein